MELYTSELTDLDRSPRNDDLFQLIGVQLAEAQQTSPLVSFRSRFPWLAVNIAGGVTAAFLSGVFCAELQQAVALALFIPVVLALSESVGIQSVMLALCVLHGRRPTIRGMLAKAFWEAATGLLLGLAGAAIVGLIAYAWLGQGVVALALCGGIAGGVACSAVIGLAMPNVLRLLHRDPHVACGPVALALADIATLLIYFYSRPLAAARRVAARNRRIFSGMRKRRSLQQGRPGREARKPSLTLAQPNRGRRGRCREARRWRRLPDACPAGRAAR